MPSAHEWIRGYAPLASIGVLPLPHVRLTHSNCAVCLLKLSKSSHVEADNCPRRAGGDQRQVEQSQGRVTSAVWELRLAPVRDDTFVRMMAVCALGRAAPGCQRVGGQQPLTGCTFGVCCPVRVSMSIVWKPEAGSSHLTAPVAAEVEGQQQRRGPIDYWPGVKFYPVPDGKSVQDRSLQFGGFFFKKIPPLAVFRPTERKDVTSAFIDALFLLFLFSVRSRIRITLIFIRFHTAINQPLWPLIYHGVVIKILVPHAAFIRKHIGWLLSLQSLMLLINRWTFTA